MVTQTITKRGIESALSVCPAAASRVERLRTRVGAVPSFQGTNLPIAGAVSPFQGTGLSFAGQRLGGYGVPMGGVAVRTIELDPFHPGDTARRPPA